MSYQLYLCCYDIQDDDNRAVVYRTLQKFQSGGQYSAYECYLEYEQKSQLEAWLSNYVEEGDSLKFQLLSNIENIVCLGKAVKPMHANFLYIG